MVWNGNPLSRLCQTRQAASDQSDTELGHPDVGPAAWSPTVERRTSTVCGGHLQPVYDIISPGGAGRRTSLTLTVQPRGPGRRRRRSPGNVRRPTGPGRDPRLVCKWTTSSPYFATARPQRGTCRKASMAYAGSACTVTQKRRRATATVAAAASEHDDSDRPGGEGGTGEPDHAYERTPCARGACPWGPFGSLKVTKTIAGPAARRHGRISILVACGGPLDTYAFVIGARPAPALGRGISRPPAGPAAPSPRLRTATLLLSLLL